MLKQLPYLLSLLIFFVSCEEVFMPSIDKIEGQLVVESLITNDTAQNYVRLLKTFGFYDDKPQSKVEGARVSLVKNDGSSIVGIENSPGYFHFNTTPEVGQKYKLKILFNNDIYESETVTMPPIPSVSNFYTGHVSVQEYINDGYGNPVAHEIAGRELYVDIPITDELSHYRFKTSAVLEWYYLPPEIGPPPPPPPPPVYGWGKYYENGNFNIAGQEKFILTEKIEKQPLMKLTYEPQTLIEPDSLPVGWIVILDEYGTSQGSYDFHEKLNSQFDATGALFDPVETQIYGNISCITDPSKRVFGYFDLNSHRQYRYYLFFSNRNAEVLPREIFRYPHIPDRGQKIGTPPDWWE